MSRHSERVESAAKAMQHHAGIFQMGRCADHHHEDSFQCVAQLAFEASDAHLFSDEAIERAGEVVDDFTHERYGDCIPPKDAAVLVRAVVEALKGGAE